VPRLACNLTEDFNLSGRSHAGEESTWQSDIPVSHTITLPPDPHVMDAIGGNHRIETAIADLVDNSIDAGASRVLIRFVIAAADVQTLYVIDDGKGMDSHQIDSAMTVGGVREYGNDELGHFGLGLKAASFSQADSLTVVSIAANSQSVGRRWLSSKASAAFECDVVSDDFCSRELQRSWGDFALTTGTIVRWDLIRSFPSTRDLSVTTRFVQDTTNRLQQYLGLVFHRFLTQGRVTIGIDVEDIGLGSGPVIEVPPLDPFGYLRPGAAGYPKSLESDIGGVKLSAECHVWPGRSQLPQFRLTNVPPEQYQGLFIYRHDRLLQAGGWNNVEIQRRDLQLARVRIDLNDQLVRCRTFRMNPEKSRVECGSEFSEALHQASASDGTTFQEYLDTARQAYKQANRRSRARPKVVPVGRGVPPTVRQAIAQELDVLPGYEEINIRWRQFPDDTFFDVDRDSSTIWLNSEYRSSLNGYSHGSLNDTPLVKTLVFLLVENLFHGSYLGSKDKDNLDLWQSLLTTAAREELA
jgi:hypothetical protein